MAQFHFVEDYERHVNELVSQHPLDEAMSLAVGGGYELIGDIASQIVVYAGAKSGMDVFDFGCGSGRVAHALAKKVDLKSFLGTDIVQPLLDYAKTKTPDHYRFVKHQALSVPAPDESFDITYAFSVFTHLLQAECYIYLQDIARVLKPRGTFVFSFLELSEGAHWGIFQNTVDTQRALQAPHLNMFIERSQIKIWAKHAGFKVTEIIDGPSKRWNGHALGQTVAILKKH
ncbi:class I SAM-dependent methyltransferase [Phyllobacterium lublinensis]|uniref:class I SAM-dependent methyltransferase n=1 Tax=Phyllobacterium lublinensis TaxID=2875708 RepID=UPI001CCBA4AD|nr:class I SAM-dependent methyltransferase [Phyllobacterium sp. 2063]MBZ9656090.1 class I SAM-dependent methyltransferase [Phyllobacterium sp. 2063]